MILHCLQRPEWESSVGQLAQDRVTGWMMAKKHNLLKSSVKHRNSLLAHSPREHLFTWDSENAFPSQFISPDQVRMVPIDLKADEAEADLQSQALFTDHRPNLIDCNQSEDGSITTSPMTLSQGLVVNVCPICTDTLPCVDRAHFRKAFTYFWLQSID